MEFICLEWIRVHSLYTNVCVVRCSHKVLFGLREKKTFVVFLESVIQQVRRFRSYISARIWEKLLLHAPAGRKMELKRCNIKYLLKQKCLIDENNWFKNDFERNGHKKCPCRSLRCLIQLSVLLSFMSTRNNVTNKTRLVRCKSI